MGQTLCEEEELLEEEKMRQYKMEKPKGRGEK